MIIEALAWSAVVAFWSIFVPEKAPHGVCREETFDMDGYVDDGGQQWTCDGKFWVMRGDADVRGVAH